MRGRPAGADCGPRFTRSGPYNHSGSGGSAQSGNQGNHVILSYFRRNREWYMTSSFHSAASRLATWRAVGDSSSIGGPFQTASKSFDPGRLAKLVAARAEAGCWIRGRKGGAARI